MGPNEFNPFETCDLIFFDSDANGRAFIAIKGAVGKPPYSLAERQVQ